MPPESTTLGLSRDAIEHALEHFRAAVRTRMLRQSKVRDEIARVALTFDSSFSAEDLYLKVREAAVADTNMATIYRNMPLLVECGMIEPTDVHEAKRQHYQVAFERGNRAFMVCTHCGRSVPFEATELLLAEQEVAARHGFLLVKRAKELRGVCAQCSASSAAPRPTSRS